MPWYVLPLCLVSAWIGSVVTLLIMILCRAVKDMDDEIDQAVRLPDERPLRLVR